jgi:hypothetical protein
LSNGDIVGIPFVVKIQAGKTEGTRQYPEPPLADSERSNAVPKSCVINIPRLRGSDGRFSKWVVAFNALKVKGRAWSVKRPPNDTFSVPRLLVTVTPAVNFPGATRSAFEQQNPNKMLTRRPSA